MLKKIYRHLIAPKVALPAASLSARKVGLTAFRVPGSNMAPTLEPSEIAWYVPGTAERPLDRAEVVALTAKEFGTAIVPSRVVALPNEVVELRNGSLFVNGACLPEPYLHAGRAEQEYSRSSPPSSVPAGHVWVLGDFRDISRDSRHIGPIPVAAVLGRITRAHAPGQHASPREVR